MIKINKEIITEYSNKAKIHPRKRINYNYHPELNDSIQRLLNCMEPGTYVRPHRHASPGKREIFIILTGKMAAIEFNNKGDVVEHTILDPLIGNYGVEFGVGSWHTIVSLESGSVVYEIKDGPYIPLIDKDFAPWAPIEGSSECSAYLQGLLKKIG